jgi:hypothetical protein
VDKVEARAFAEQTLQLLREQPYEVLVERYLSKPDVTEMVGVSGTRYQVEITAFWDSGKPGNVRVLAAVDDGGWRASKPLSTDFIMAPDGSFVGEGDDL